MLINSAERAFLRSYLETVFLLFSKYSFSEMLVTPAISASTGELTAHLSCYAAATRGNVRRKSYLADELKVHLNGKGAEKAFLDAMSAFFNPLTSSRNLELLFLAFSPKIEAEDIYPFENRKKSLIDPSLVDAFLQEQKGLRWTSILRPGFAEILL